MAHWFSSRAQFINTSSKQRAKATQLLPETLWIDEPLPSGTPPEDTAVVTIARQFGSGGAEIARLVAQQSGLNYVDYQIIAEVARRLDVDVEHVARQDEQTTSMTGHILAALKASAPFMHYNTVFETPSTQAQSQELAYLHLTQKVILELASQGNAVIVGRGSQFLLHHAPRTLHISIFAPLPYRIENTMQRFQLNHSMAELLIQQRDYELESYLRRYYGADGRQSGQYHLLINTSLFSYELAANFICQALPTVKKIS